MAEWIRFWIVAVFLAAGVLCVVASNLVELLDFKKIRDKGKEAVT